MDGAATRDQLVSHGDCEDGAATRDQLVSHGDGEDGAGSGDHGRNVPWYTSWCHIVCQLVSHRDSEDGAASGDPPVSDPSRKCNLHGVGYAAPSKLHVSGGFTTVLDLHLLHVKSQTATSLLEHVPLVPCCPTSCCASHNSLSPISNIIVHPSCPSSNLIVLPRPTQKKVHNQIRTSVHIHHLPMLTDGMSCLTFQYVYIISLC